MSLLSGGCGGSCAVVAGAGGAGSLFCCTFRLYGLRTPQFLVCAAAYLICIYAVSDAA